MAGGIRWRSGTERFNKNIAALKESDNETQVRIEYLNPFFKELGWDVENRSSNSRWNLYDRINKETKLICIIILTAILYTVII